MSRLRPWAFGIAIAIGLGILAVVTLRGVAPRPETLQEPADLPAETAAVSPAAPVPSPAPAAVEAPPPWASALPETAPAETTKAPTLREQQLAVLQQSMSAMLAEAVDRSAASSVHVRKALDTLEAMDDPAIKAQFNLPALRHNLEISLQLQAIAQEMQAEVATPRTPERDARIEALRKEFETLRQQLRTDVVPPGARPPTATSGDA